VPESIYERYGWVVLILVGAPILLTLLVGTFLAWWMRMGASASRTAAFVVSGVFALGCLVGLVAFLVSDVYFLIAALLTFACLIAPGARHPRRVCRAKPGNRVIRAGPVGPTCR
jgi:hypothetical protein